MSAASRREAGCQPPASCSLEIVGGSESASALIPVMMAVSAYCVPHSSMPLLLPLAMDHGACIFQLVTQTSLDLLCELCSLELAFIFGDQVRVYVRQESMSRHQHR